MELCNSARDGARRRCRLRPGLDRGSGLGCRSEPRQLHRGRGRGGFRSARLRPRRGRPARLDGVRAACRIAGNGVVPTAQRAGAVLRLRRPIRPAGRGPRRATREGRKRARHVRPPSRERRRQLGHLAHARRAHDRSAASRQGGAAVARLRAVNVLPAGKSRDLGEDGRHSGDGRDRRSQASPTTPSVTTSPTAPTASVVARLPDGCGAGRTASATGQRTLLPSG